MEQAVTVVKHEPGDERFFSATNIKLEICFPQLPVEFEARTDESSQYTRSENICVKVESDLPAIKREPGSPVDGEKDGGVIFTDIDMAVPDVKQECSNYCRNADTRVGLLRLQDSIPTDAATKPGRKPESEMSKSDGTTFSEGKSSSRSYCTYTCSDKSKLRHLLTHTKDKQCKNDGDFYTHELTHTAEKSDLKNHESHPAEKLFTCWQCRYTSKRKLDLSRHVLTHTGEKLFSCSKCSHTCNRKSSLSKHMLTHFEEKPFACTQCTYTSGDKSNLKRHVLTHTADKPFSCSRCSYTCISKGDLSGHEFTHSAEKPFSCSECSYKCKRKRDLIIHQLTHSEEKPISCSRCTYTCSNTNNLRSHMLSHAVEKPFACAECEYKCKRKRELTIHQLTHSREKPFACPICAYNCNTKRSYKIHMNKHV